MGEYLRQVTEIVKEPSLEGTQGKRVSLGLGAGASEGAKIHLWGLDNACAAWNLPLEFSLLSFCLLSWGLGEVYSFAPHSRAFKDKLSAFQHVGRTQHIVLQLPNDFPICPPFKGIY